jgi:hypothetical protein
MKERLCETEESWRASAREKDPAREPGRKKKNKTCTDTEHARFEDFVHQIEQICIHNLPKKYIVHSN